MTTRTPLLTAVLALAAPSLATAQILLRDIGQGVDLRDPRTDPRGMTPALGTVLLSLTLPDTGTELWRTDGTAAGTALVADLERGYRSSFPTDLTPVGPGAAVFSAETPLSGREPYLVDVSGVRPLGDLRAGVRGSNPGGFTVTGGLVLFFADDGIRGNELWRTDGTVAGTVPVADLTPGAVGSNISDIVAIGGQALVFVNGLPSGDWSLWSTDGTAAGTQLVIRLPHGAPWEPIRARGTIGGRVLFDGWDAQSGREPWITDGTAAGTQRLADVAPGAASSTPALTERRAAVEVGGGLLFLAAAPAEQLWWTDGTVAGTRLSSSSAALGTDTILHDRLPGGDVLVTTHGTAGSSGAMRLLRSDGTVAGTRQFLSLPPSQQVDGDRGVASGGFVWFPGCGTEGCELWRTDGTAAGTGLVAELAPGPEGSGIRSLTLVPGGVVFTADGVRGATGELWSSDGTQTGTAFLDLAPRPLNAGSAPSPLGTFRGRSHWATADGGNPWRWWVTDGTPAGTTELLGMPRLDSVPEPGSAEAEAFFVFAGVRQGSGLEPWRSDGTPAGTAVLEVRPGALSSSPRGFTPFAGRVVFAADDGVHGRELWTTDGTAAGTALLIDLEPGAPSSDPRHLTVWDDRLWFVARTAATGDELFVTDGTPTGTRLVADVSPGVVSGVVRATEGPTLVPFAGALYFPGAGGLTGTELWRSDGTAAGTRMVRDLLPGFFASSAPRGLHVAGGRLVMLASESSGVALWSSDGTTAGTVRLAQFADAAHAAGLGNDTMVFFATENGNPSVLWRTDGSATGTARVTTINPSGIDWQPPVWSAAGASRLLLRANDGIHGTELWVTDGTAAGTRLATDLHGTDSDPRDVVRSGAQIVFTADDGRVGNELRALDLAGLGDYAVEGYGSGCPAPRGALPTIGTSGPVRTSVSWSATLDTAPANAAAVLLVGLARLSIPLPIDCALWTTPLVTLGAATDATGRAAIAFPPAPGLTGIPLRMQFVALAPGGPLLGLGVATGGLEVVGGR